MSDNGPTLREFLEQRFALEHAVIEQRVHELEKRIALQVALAERALVTQATEYERRLTALNHAHEDAIKERGRVLPREMFEAFTKEYDEFRASTAVRLQEIATRASTWTVAIGLFTVLMSILIQWLEIGKPR